MFFGHYSMDESIKYSAREEQMFYSSHMDIKLCLAAVVPVHVPCRTQRYLCESRVLCFITIFVVGIVVVSAAGASCGFAATSVAFILLLFVLV